MSKMKGSRNKATAETQEFLFAPTDSATGLRQDEKEAMDQARQFAEAQKKIEEAAISDDQKKMILQEIQVDVFTKLRRYVELTPSMCDVRGCGYDAAKAMDCAGWEEAPIDQVLPDGKTYGEKLIELKERHRATAHSVNSLDSHIVMKSELDKRGWGTKGANINFLNAPLK